MISVTLCTVLLWDFSGISCGFFVVVRVNNLVILTFLTVWVGKAPLPLLPSVDIDRKGEVTLSPSSGVLVLEGRA